MRFIVEIIGSPPPLDVEVPSVMLHVHVCRVRARDDEIQGLRTYWCTRLREEVLRLRMKQSLSVTNVGPGK